MSLFEQYPYTNFHELNLDWIIKKIKELDDKFDDAISAKIKFADPLQWDITTPYEALTIVVDNNKAYLSMKPVPPGILLTNDEYWQQIFDMSELYDMIDDLEQSVNDEIDDFENDVNDTVTALDNNTVKNNNARHVLFCGDSYSTVHDGLLYNTFESLCGVPAAQCHDLAVSGASFAQSANTYLNQISGYSGDKTVITDIVVAGGINDALAAFDIETYPDLTTLIAAIQAFYTYAKNNYPKAKVSIAYIGGCLPS